MLGRVERAKLAERITAKRHQDAVRALGLVPLSASGDETALQKEVVARYRVIQEFLRSGRQFGSQRRASEELAARIGLENLARTAGYPDPVRLQWAMEAQLVADLKGKPVRANYYEFVARLEIDQWGAPVLTFFKNGQPVKALPGAVKKEPLVAEMVARKQEIERQKGRMRLSLEQAMCRGDRFEATELVELLDHPVLAPMLEKLVFVGEAGEGLAGYPQMQDEGDSRQLVMRFYDNSFMPVGAGTWLRIAHPYDLLKGGAWPS